MPSTSSPSTILLAARFADPLIASLGTGHCYIGPFPGPSSTAVRELPAPLAASVRALVRGLTGRRVGIYGLGAIGVKIARRVVACEARVGYHNRNPRTDVPYDYFPSLVALARWADALVVAVRGDQSTRHAVDAAVLRALGSEGHVVNISRGFVIDEAVLIAALRDGTMAGAGLDVFEHEPQVPQARCASFRTWRSPHTSAVPRWKRRRRWVRWCDATSTPSSPAKRCPTPCRKPGADWRSLSTQERRVTSLEATRAAAPTFAAPTRVAAVQS